MTNVPPKILIIRRSVDMSRLPFPPRKGKIKSVTWVCSYCGSENHDSWPKCNSCGAPRERSK